MVVLGVKEREEVLTSIISKDETKTMIRSLLYDMFTKSMVFHGAYTTNKNIKHIIIDSGNKLPKVGVS